MQLKILAFLLLLKIRGCFHGSDAETKHLAEEQTPRLSGSPRSLAWHFDLMMTVGQEVDTDLFLLLQIITNKRCFSAPQKMISGIKRNSNWQA